MARKCPACKGTGTKRSGWLSWIPVVSGTCPECDGAGALENGLEDARSAPRPLSTPKPTITPAAPKSDQVCCFERHTSFVDNAVFLSDMRHAVSIERNGYLRAWELSTLEELGLIKATSEDQDLKSRVLVVRPGTQQAIFVSEKYGDFALVRQWDPVHGVLSDVSQLKTQRLGSTYLTDAVFSPDCRFMLGVGRKNICLYNVEQQEPLAVFQVGTPVPGACETALSPDARHMLCAEGDSIIYLIDLQDGKRIVELRGHEGEVSMVKFAPSV